MALVLYTMPILFISKVSRIGLPAASAIQILQSSKQCCLGDATTLGLTIPLQFFYISTCRHVGIVSLRFLSLFSSEAASSCSLAAAVVLKPLLPGCCHPRSHCCEGHQVYRAKEPESKTQALTVCFACLQLGFCKSCDYKSTRFLEHL